MKDSAAAPASANWAGRGAVEIPDVSAHILHFVSTKHIPYDVVAVRCPWCHANHRHTCVGLRLASCGGGTYNVVVGGAR